MKQSSLKLLLAAACLLFSFGLRAQTTYSAGGLTVVVNDSMRHDSTTCGTSCDITYTITVNSSFLGDSLSVIDTGDASLLFTLVNTTGASPWTTVTLLPTYWGGSAIADAQVFSGYVHFNGPVVKVISNTDTIHYIVNTDSLSVPNPCIYDLVTGIVYADLNGDCIYNSGDVPLNGMEISGLEPAWFVGNGITNSTGSYSMLMAESWMTNYTVSLPSYYSFIFPHTPCFSGSLYFTTLPQTNVDFPLQCTNLIDVECWAGAPANARPNRPFFLHPYVSNIGCDTASGTLTLIKDSRVAYDPSLSSNPAISISGDTLIWYYYDLTNLSSGAYWNNFMSSIYLTPNSTVNIGDTLCFHIFTGVPVNDINPANNDYTICLPVVNSYDPNEKEVSPKGDGPTGEIGASTPELTYTIHFQNTGTDVAYDVSVIDTLSPNVDASSLKIMGTSHNMLPEWIAPGVVKFKFSNINLADSFSNEPASHGYVRFKVKMHSGLTTGTQIKNKGYIYFDLNPPVITNEALNTIIHTVSVNNVAVSNVKVYPNPASDAIYVENLQDGTITILNMNGSLVFNQNITNNKTEININRLPAGVYILKTVSKDGVTTRKFVKE